MHAAATQPGRVECDGAKAPSPEQEQFLSLLEVHQRLLLKVCWAYSRGSHDWDDLFQEIVARLWAAFGRYDRNRKFSTWMYRVALNVAIDFRRRQRWRQNEAKRLQGDPASEPGRGTHDDLEQEQLRQLHELLERLPDADRALLLLHLEGNSHREIGEVVGISESNVGTRLARLRKSLRESVQTRHD
jgi:RNA polymerase sigma-70 factor (ECF subfamily)